MVRLLRMWATSRVGADRSLGQSSRGRPSIACRRLIDHGGRDGGRGHAPFQAGPHQLADDPMGGPEGEVPLLHDLVGELRGLAEVGAGPCPHELGLDGQGGEDAAHEAQGGPGPVEGAPRPRSRGLEVAQLLGEGLELGEDRHGVADALRRQVADPLQGGRVLLLRHDGGGPAVGVGEFDHAELVGAPDVEVVRQAGDVGGGDGRVGHALQGEISVDGRVARVLHDAVEAEQFGHALRFRGNPEPVEMAAPMGDWLTRR